jgi:O-methyltransferase
MICENYNSQKNYMQAIKTFLKRIINNLGFIIFRVPTAAAAAECSQYQAIRPTSTYNPWNKDKLFSQTYQTIQKFTLVDKYRCFELWELVKQSSKLANGAIIEIGVWRGGTGALIAKQAKKCGIPSKVYLCDTLTGLVKTGPRDSIYKGSEHANTSREIVENLIYGQMNLDNVRILEGIFPDQTGDEVKNLQFRFCHIDVDVYQSAKDIADYIWNKMVSGGIIVYDDYGSWGCDGITKYVDEQMLYKDRVVIYNLNGHAIVIKL